MKKIVWMACGMALMCASLNASANVRYDDPQEEVQKKEVPNPEKAAQRRTDEMDKALNLTEKQYKKIYKLFLKEEKEKVEAMMQRHPGGMNGQPPMAGRPPMGGRTPSDGRWNATAGWRIPRNGRISGRHEPGRTDEGACREDAEGAGKAGEENPQDSHRRTVCHLADRETAAAGIASDAGRRETGARTSWIRGRGSSVARYGSRVNGIPDFPAG